MVAKLFYWTKITNRENKRIFRWLFLLQSTDKRIFWRSWSTRRRYPNSNEKNVSSMKKFIIFQYFWKYTLCNYYFFTDTCLYNDYRWFGFSTNLTEEGYQVIVTRNITDEDVPGRYLDHWTKYYYMCIDWNLKRETVNGVIIIYDMATTNKNELLTQVTPTFLRKSLQCSVSFKVHIFFFNIAAKYVWLLFIYFRCNIIFRFLMKQGNFITTHVLYIIFWLVNCYMNFLYIYNIYYGKTRIPMKSRIYWEIFGFTDCCRQRWIQRKGWHRGTCPFYY